MAEHSDGSFSIGSGTWPGTSKLIEEMGELTQVLGKLMAAHGEVEHWDGTNLRDRLYEELGDLSAAIEFFVEANGLSDDRLLQRTAEKFNRFVEWHAEGIANRPSLEPAP